MRVGAQGASAARDARLAGGRDRARLGARRQRGRGARPAAAHPRRRRQHGQEPRGRLRVVAHARHATRPARMEARRQRHLPGGASSRGLDAARLGLGRAAQRTSPNSSNGRRACCARSAADASRSKPSWPARPAGHARKRPPSRPARPRAPRATRPPTAPPHAHGSANTSTLTSSPRCSRPAATRRRRLTRADSAASSSSLLGEHGLTERDSSFARGDVVRELAFALGSAPDSDDPARRSRLVPRARAGRPAGRAALHDPQPASRRTAHHASSRNDPRRAQLVLSPGPGGRSASRASRHERGFALSDEQRALVHGVTRRRRLGVARARRRRIRQDNHARRNRPGLRAAPASPSHGVAPTGAAARVMSEAGIPARTVERALLDREQALRAGIRPTPGIVLVDEAGTIGTRTLARLAQAVALRRRQARAGRRRRATPTRRQPARPTPTCSTSSGRCTRSRRRGASSRPTGEPDLAEARALARLRAGTLEGAAAYLNHKQQTGTSARSTATPRSPPPLPGTPSTSRQGADPARIALIARSHELRGLLNQRARDSMRDAGRLGPDVHGLARMHRSRSETSSSAAETTAVSAVTNGARGRITAITPTRAHARHDRPAQRLDPRGLRARGRARARLRHHRPSRPSSDLRRRHGRRPAPPPHPAVELHRALAQPHPNRAPPPHRSAPRAARRARTTARSASTTPTRSRALATCMTRDER